MHCCLDCLYSLLQEIYPPEVKDFVYITDNAYTKDDILKMEAGLDSLPVRHLEACLN